MNDLKTEYRAHKPAEPLKLDGNKLVGYAIVYNSDSHDLGGFVERFLPGSVTDSINSGLVTAVLDHSDAKPLANQSAGTLKLTEDRKGVWSEIELPDTSYVADMRALMALNNYRGQSFQFGARQEWMTWSKRDGQNVREVNRAVVNHVSPVMQPAYPATSIALRNLASGETVTAADEYGIDLDDLAKIFVSVKRGLAVTDTETEIARQAMSLLRPTIRFAALDAAEDRAARLLL